MNYGDKIVSSVCVHLLMVHGNVDDETPLIGQVQYVTRTNLVNEHSRSCEILECWVQSLRNCILYSVFKNHVPVSKYKANDSILSFLE